MSNSVRRLVMCSAVLWLAVPGIVTAQAPVELTGRVVNMQGGGSTFVTLHADSFTPDGEILQYIDVLQQKGMDGVTAAMFKAKEPE